MIASRKLCREQLRPGRSVHPQRHRHEGAGGAFAILDRGAISRPTALPPRGGHQPASLQAPLVRRRGGSGAADGALRIAVFGVSTVSQVRVRVGEEVLREGPPRLIAPVHAPEFVM